MFCRSFSAGKIRLKSVWIAGMSALLTWLLLRYTKTVAYHVLSAPVSLCPMCGECM